MPSQHLSHSTHASSTSYPRKRKWEDLGQALKDFDSINLTGVKEFIIPGDRGVGKVGYMNDGTKVVVRSWSSDASSNSPTLEIQYKDSPILDRGIKIRY